MKQNKHFILLVAFCIGFVTILHAQHRRYAIKNGFGIYGGITQYDILTDNFETKPGNGWMVGASATVDLPHKWYNISYTIQLAENEVGIATRPVALPSQSQFLDYKIFTAQIALLMHVKLIKSFLTIDIGPMLQYNGELKLQDDQYENFIVANYDNLLAKDISDVNKFNIDGTVGVSAGFSHFRVKAQYIYGFTNMLGKLDKDDNLDLTGNDKKIKGNQSIFAFTAMITF
ncbi:outer membrane beta-barrel protein [Mangrovimonas spongiae]|uniref:PorT family protein n=1 Tax=Mangrovimonas spongiae TaxID=2494697 RepID=A0A428K564_9FLAO|nr:outer membrane beta-barrel protein [Mangrovimonas spongiae]RSK41543.1 hypothetical protein EJA19_01315 [Mangrovimonas spongiae]